MAPFDDAVPAVLAKWRRVLVETLGGVDDGVSVVVVGSSDKRHVFTLTISLGAGDTDTDVLCLPVSFGLTAGDRVVAEGDCRLRFMPSTSARRTTTGELVGTIRWSTSRLRRFRSLGHGRTSIEQAVGSCFQDYLSALGRMSIERR